MNKVNSTNSRLTYNTTPYSQVVTKLGRLEKLSKQLKIFEEKPFEICPKCKAKLFNLKHFYKHIETDHPTDRRHQKDYVYKHISHKNTVPTSSKSILTYENLVIDKPCPDVNVEFDVQMNESYSDTGNSEEEEEDETVEEDDVQVVEVDLETLNFESQKNSNEVSFNLSRCDLIDSLIHDEFFNKLMSKILKHKMKSIASSHLNEIVADMLELYTTIGGDPENFQKYITVALSDHYQQQYVLRYNKFYIKPKIYEIHTPGFDKPYKYSCLPLIPLCQKIFKNESLVAKILEEQNLELSDLDDPNLIIRSVMEAGIFPRIKGKGKMEMFIDDCVIAPSCGLSNSYQKFTFIYATFADIPIQHRSHCEDMELILMANRSEMKRRKLDILDVLKHSPLRREAHFLATTGIDVTFKGKSVNIKVVISGLLGDNLGMYESMGFKRSFNKNAFICRECGIKGISCDHNSIQNLDIHPRPLINPNKPTQIDLAKFGSLRYFLFDGIDGITRFNISPPDLMHDLPEGVLLDVLELILTALVSIQKIKGKSVRPFFDKETVEKRFSEFDFFYGTPKLTWVSGKGFKIRGKAIQKLEAFLKLDVILFEELKPESAEFKLFLSLKHFTLLAFSQTFTSLQLNNLDILSKNVLNDFSTLYFQINHHLDPKETDVIYCKLHNLTHYADLTRLFGPLRDYLNFKYERKHQFPKTIARVCKSFVNSALTITTRHQAMRAMIDEQSNLSQIDYFKATKQSNELFMDNKPSECPSKPSFEFEHPFTLGKNVLRKIVNSQFKEEIWIHVREFYRESDENGRICCKGDIYEITQFEKDGRQHCALRYNSLKLIECVHKDMFVWLDDLNFMNDFMYEDKDADIWLIEFVC